MRPTTIDLFCGAGGITEGFRQAGFRCVYANDVNPLAIETFQHNHPDCTSEAKPIESVDVKKLRRDLGLERGELDVLCGGPPCQGFSINAPERFLDDPRNALFRHFVRFLAEFRPKTFLFENVPGLISLANERIFEQVLKELHNCGYHTSSKILFAAHYGVPQQRWRLIIIGSSVDPLPEHPTPTHYAKARANFRGGTSMTFRLTPESAESLLSATTVRDAIYDLPRLKMGFGNERIQLNGSIRSEYATAMRSPDGITYNHVAAKLSSLNKERLKYIKPGGSWRDIPHELLPEGMKRARRSDHTKRYGRLKFDGFASTIMTKCDPHWGPVFLPDQDRSLTVREAARLQSFPDHYRFLGPRVSQYEQVGNAVPPLMARAIAESIKKALSARKRLRRAS